MNEANSVLERKLNQLAEVLANHPELTHVYMRTDDERLVDITVDQAKPTLIRHPDWTIEPVQRGEKPLKVKNELAEADHAPEPVDDIEVPAKPSEEVEKTSEEATTEKPAKNKPGRPAKQ